MLLSKRLGMMSVVTVPKRIYVAAVSAEGGSPLNAFDNCLVRAGLEGISLIKVTSILPPNMEILSSPPNYPPGANVPAIYAYAVSSDPGTLVSAAIALAYTKSLTLVAEHAVVGEDEERVREYVLKAVREMARARNLEISNIVIKSTSHRVRKVGCSLAIVTQI